MDTRIALIGIVVNHSESVDKLNHLLSEYGQYIIGRMGLPYREKGNSQKFHIYFFSDSLWFFLFLHATIHFR